jgi:AcrR family transcriptional regulator
MTVNFDERAGTGKNEGMAGRTNQKERTRGAILDATRALIADGSEVSMPTVAQRALVSEATAYRYFPDLATLLREAFAATWPTPTEALKPIAHSNDPVERIAYAAEFLLRRTIAHEGAVRALIAASVTRPQVAAARPANRFGLIDAALEPVTTIDPTRLAQLKLDLAVVISAEALFNLMDLCGLGPDAAVASAVTTARTLTAAAVRTR